MELAVDGVADFPFEGAERFLAGLALGSFLVVVGAAVAVPLPDLGDGGHVDGVVEAPVAAPGQPEHLPLSRRHFDRGGAVVGSELVSAGEAGDVGDVAEDGGGDDRADTEDAGHGAAGGADGGRDRLPGLGQHAVQAAQVSGELGGDLVPGGRDRPGRRVGLEQGGGCGRGDGFGHPAGDDLAERSVQPAGRLAAQPGQVAVPLRPDL